MDLNQRKLIKSEWDSIEIPVADTEIQILNMIIGGYHNVSIKLNNFNSIFTLLKIQYTEKMEDYLYVKYLSEKAEPIDIKLKNINNEHKLIKISANIKPNSMDKIRLDKVDNNLLSKNNVYEYLLLDYAEKLMNINDTLNMSNNRVAYVKFHYYYYCLYKLVRNNVLLLNTHLKKMIYDILDIFENRINKAVIIYNAVEFVEKNENILKYSDLCLYEHQKNIFTLIKTNTPKLILYMAPTGTGKTLTPIALSEGKRVIFVCAARHVGLALARAAISVNKKIAFAFGCSSADDIRLHNSAAVDYTKNKRSGGIGKIDNSNGQNVEIIICDIRSYLPAMYYMLAFFDEPNIITYWDEPTITMDYDEHEFHKTIRKNWKKNKISTVVLSSATLPKKHELTETINDFLNKFPGAEVCNIVSHDCKKSIPIINNNGYVVLPHYLSDNYEHIIEIADHIMNNLTLLRYFDLKEIVSFISFICENNFNNRKTSLDRYFVDLDYINMKNIKTYYIELLKNIKPEKWNIIYEHFMEIRKPRICENNSVDLKGDRIKKIFSTGPGILTRPVNGMEGQPIVRLHSEIIPNTKSINTSSGEQEVKGTSGVYVTTKDAYTLTDGPTIFISNDIEKIAKFCIQQANIPNIVMSDIMKKIDYNNIINKQINDKNNELDQIKQNIEGKAKNDVNAGGSGVSVSTRHKSNKYSKKIGKDIPYELQDKNVINKLTEQVNSLRAMIKNASLNDTFIPNKKAHLEKWVPNTNITNAFTSSISENIVSDIMALNGIDNLWKILLMMGIGVFTNHNNITYTEIMKNLADEQKLYLIIATSDYIYGTNYQFCHCFLSKDLNLTQEKVIQAMGRVGRNNIQQTYTVRFRDDDQIAKLFTSDTEKPEIINMNKLFNTKKIIYENGEYIEIEDEEDNCEDEQVDDSDYE